MKMLYASIKTSGEVETDSRRCEYTAHFTAKKLRQPADPQDRTDDNPEFIELDLCELRVIYWDDEGNLKGEYTHSEMSEWEINTWEAKIQMRIKKKLDAGDFDDQSWEEDCNG